MSSGIDGSHMRWRICLAASGEVMPMLQFGAFLPLSLKQANTLNFQPFLWNVKTYQLKTSVDPRKQKFSAWLLTLVGYTHELFDELHSPSPKWAFILRLQLRKKGTLAKVNDPPDLLHCNFRDMLFQYLLIIAARTFSNWRHWAVQRLESGNTR